MPTKAPGFQETVHPTPTMPLNQEGPPNSDNVHNLMFPPAYDTTRMRHVSRFDKNAIFAMAGGLLIILICVAFLCFLWFGNEDNSVWRHIVITNWVSRSITITSLILRWSVTAQAVVMTSMIAALLLQMSQTPLTQAAAVSLAVCSNRGPHELIFRLPHSLGSRSWLFWLVVLLMTCITTLLQFTSTALLSDVGSGIIIDSQSLKISYGINSSFGGSLAASGGYIAARPLSYPAFAEYTEPASPRDGITDTGLSMRAFLPIDPRSSREALVSYNGMATVMDTRVACMRPTFANVTVQSYGIYRWIAGSVWTKLKVPRMNTTLGMDGDVQPSHFNCSYSLDQGDPDSSLRISFCNVYFMDENDDRDTGIISDMEPIPPEPYTASSPGGMYLIINTTGAHTDWNEVNNAGRNLRIETVVQDKSEWTTLESDVKGLSFVMTLCSFDPVVQDMNITATRTKGGAEPMARWLNSTSTYDTEAILAQLGGTKDHLSYDDRGIFKLAKKESWLTPPSVIDRGTYWESSPAPPADPYYILFGAFDGLPGGGGYLINLFGSDDSGDANGIRLNRLHGEVFKETIKATGSAAWAIQALVTSLYSMAYYDYIFQFDIPAPADLKAEQVRAKDGLIGGSWAAVARISGQPTDDWLAKANQHAVVISNYNRSENPMFSTPCRFQRAPQPDREMKVWEPLGKFLQAQVRGSFEPYFTIQEQGYPSEEITVPLSEDTINAMCVRGNLELDVIEFRENKEFSPIHMSLCLEDNSSSGSIDRSFPISGFPRELMDEHRQPGPPRTTVNSELRRDSSGRRFPYTRAMHNKGSIDEHDLDALGNLTLSPWLTDLKNGSNMFNVSPSETEQVYELEG
ncbi:hypothetical protein FocTR4_00011038 [Fusarium oxysporum f. sp. cubense]|uniref:Uncharacterized protein n=1 Tax=Fusarium oxysporum f. sp. cubense TaxID=61366 RepID=A0A5C6SG05_FUSOC|nr:hypothetical protein FocTR4_00011038 [Fusarium oxysporum f. sp. cubense]